MKGEAECCRDWSLEFGASTARHAYTFQASLQSCLSFKRWRGLGMNDGHMCGVSTSISWTGSSQRFIRLKWCYEFWLLVLSEVVTATCGIHTIGSTLSLFSIPALWEVHNCT
ncbi:uncharacterized protein LOC112351144 [Selaginella moellendorffii]|uniref:uncharacterized protein LOC112351144 n=1 Tax=Selaginella moellendorffii TaxID=88036 RepID=UPI000D1C3913|nr:uncharacterized protein LOC112351144 [Selaginella moellendorffii]|eukprot:XP_024544242.1 uncharacterized protein LOC112351144 [Selaginella moellendorffii]